MSTEKKGNNELEWEPAPQTVDDSLDDALDAAASLHPAALKTEAELEESPVTAPLPTISQPPKNAPPQNIAPQNSPPQNIAAPRVPNFAQAPLPPFPSQQMGPDPLQLPGFQPAPVPRSYPVLGSVLSVFGVLLWSFVIAGQFTTSWMSGAPLSEGLAAAMVFLATSVALVLALRRSRVVPMPSTRAIVSRAVLVALGAFISFCLAIAVATIAGAFLSRNHDLLFAFMLTVIAGGALVFGGRLTVRTPIMRSHGQKFAMVAAWLGAIVLTLVAFAELAANG